MSNMAKIPTLTDLIADTEMSLKENGLMVLLNQNPPETWMSDHPMAKVKINGQNVPAKYMPVGRVEYLLSRIFGKWRLEVKSVNAIANSVVVTVRLHVLNPITNEWDWNDGIGASPIQTESGAGAMEWDKVKSAAVQMAAPSAETYAFKDAAEKFGKIFGKDVNRQDINYNSLLKVQTTLQDLTDLFNEVADSLPPNNYKAVSEIITERREGDYVAAYKQIIKFKSTGQ